MTDTTVARTPDTLDQLTEGFRALAACFREGSGKASAILDRIAQVLVRERLILLGRDCAQAARGQASQQADGAEPPDAPTAEDFGWCARELGAELSADDRAAVAQGYAERMHAVRRR